MKMRTALSLALGASLIAAPVAASAGQRVSSPLAEDEQLSGSPIFLILAIALAVGILVVVTSDDDQAVSP